MPRRRQQTRPTPNKIKPDALPEYVYWDTKGSGRWVWRRYNPDTKRSTSVRLAGQEATLREIWEAYERLTRSQSNKRTLRWLMDKFTQSTEWGELSPATQADYNKCAKAMFSTPTKSGTQAGDVGLAEWSPGGVRAYLDLRAKSARSRANHELRFIRRLFAWGVERDLMTTNPARGVRVLKEPPRQRYVEDDEYERFQLFIAPRFPHLALVMEFAYLCRLRVSEVCDMRRDGIQEEGLFSTRRKGSKDAFTEWTPRLRLAVDRALALGEGEWLLVSVNGEQMKVSSLETNWQRAMVEWAAAGNPRFTIHDLKRKGVSDAEGDKLAASGHRSRAMLKVYDVLPARAKATR